jgi:Na+/serine symporter
LQNHVAIGMSVQKVGEIVYFVVNNAPQGIFGVVLCDFVARKGV